MGGIGLIIASGKTRNTQKERSTNMQELQRANLLNTAQKIRTSLIQKRLANMSRNLAGLSRKKIFQIKDDLKRLDQSITRHQLHIIH